MAQTGVVLAFGIADAALAVFLLVLNISFARSMCQHHQLFKQNRGAASISLVITNLFGIYPIFAASSLFIRVHGDYSQQDLADYEHKIMIPAAPTYWIAQSLMVLLFVLRMEKVFGATQWAVSDRRRQCLYCNAIVLIVLAASISVPLAINNAVFAFLALLSMWVLLHFSLSLTLIILFMNTVRHIVVTRTKLEHSSRASMEISDAEHPTQSAQPSNTEEMVKENELFQVAIKHNILVRIALISTFVSFVITFVTLAMDNDSIRFIAGTAMAIDCAISASCIYLLFAFHHPLYETVCSRLHHHCETSKAEKINSFISD